MSVDANNPASPSLAGVRRRRYSEEAGVALRTDAAGAAVATLPDSLPLDFTRVWAALAVAAVGLYFLYSTAFLNLYNKWSSDAGWSHGFVVPLISLFFIRLKWDVLRLLVPRGTWLGLLVMLVGISGQVLFRVTGLAHMSAVSILVVLFGGVLLVFGKEFLKVLWLPIAYLAFAVPPPDTLYVKMTSPMQTIAAELGIQILPLLGIGANRTGTVINLDWHGMQKNLFVADACSGMRMLVAFFALAVALAYTTHRPIWQKVLLAGCALPIAILCNGLRVALTGYLAVRHGGEWAEGKAHEYFGMVMLIPAMIMQLGIAWIFDHLFIEDTTTPPAPGGEP